MTSHGYEGSPVLRQFGAAMARRGLVPPQRLVADGHIHRCHLKSRNGRGDGSYLLHLDGAVPAGGFKNWQDGLGWENWHFDPGRELTVAERDEVKRKAEAAAKARAQAKAHDQAQAQKKAGRLWELAQPCSENHPYLKRKDVGPHGVRLLYGSVVVPVRDIDGQLHSIQFIRSDGSKRFLRGGRIKGCFHRFAGNEGCLIICEGFATGASIHAATGNSVIIAFDAGNLKSVAEAAHKQCHSDIVIAADDDWKTKGNPGLTKATEAARAIGAKLAVPNFGVNRRDRDKDFNDLATFIGREAVKRCIDAALAPEPAPEQIDLKAEIARLAKLGKAEYDRERAGAAKRLGVRVGTLDAEVAKERSSVSAEDYDLPHWRVEPWPDPVDGAKLLDEIAVIFSRYIVLPKHGATALALWVVHAWAFDASDVSPFLLLKSPEKRCGKTSVLIILMFLTPRSELSGNISAASIFRYVEEKRPTLLPEAATLCARCGCSDGRLESHHVKVNGVEREAFLHPECWLAWRTHGANKVAPEWRRTI